jgi:hypothetical protein
MSEVIPQVILGEEGNINMGSNPESYRAMHWEDEDDFNKIDTFI